MLCDILDRAATPSTDVSSTESDPSDPDAGGIGGEVPTPVTFAWPYPMDTGLKLQWLQQLQPSENGQALDTLRATPVSPSQTDPSEAIGMKTVVASPKVPPTPSSSASTAEPSTTPSMPKRGNTRSPQRSYRSATPSSRPQAQEITQGSEQAVWERLHQRAIRNTRPISPVRQVLPTQPTQRTTPQRVDATGVWDRLYKDNDLRKERLRSAEQTKAQTQQQHEELVKAMCPFRPEIATQVHPNQNSEGDVFQRLNKPRPSVAPPPPRDEWTFTPTTLKRGVSPARERTDCHSCCTATSKECTFRPQVAPRPRSPQSVPVPHHVCDTPALRDNAANCTFRPTITSPPPIARNSPTRGSVFDRLYEDGVCRHTLRSPSPNGPRNQSCARACSPERERKSLGLSSPATRGRPPLRPHAPPLARQAPQGTGRPAIDAETIPATAPQPPQSTQPPASTDGLRVPPPEAVVLLASAERKWLHGDLPAALADFASVLEMDPNSSRARCGELAIRSMLGEEPASSAYAAVCSLQLTDPIALRYRGVLKTVVRDISGAMVDFNAAIRVQPDCASVYVSRGLLQENFLKDYSAAHADYTFAINVGPELAIAYCARANLSANKMGNHAEAWKDVVNAMALDEECTTRYFRRVQGGFRPLNGDSGQLQTPSESSDERSDLQGSAAPLPATPVAPVPRPVQHSPHEVHSPRPAGNGRGDSRGPFDERWRGQSESF
eukprot:TRINITY_DN6145_c0_g1_i1.p1 TRINITY_DN6145_c0_g1~~TRINITY_DN6145_c0_g1_i1.p1  ORF type:complete len:722 (-),score=64.63 TRINITY_DN6145_c0_g1_i1:45-2210(-)